MKIYLHADSYTENCGGAIEGDEWSRDSTSTTWDFGRVTAEERGSYDYLEIGDGFAIGDRIFVIVAVWSDGDSFGHDSGSRFEMLAAYKDPILAQKAMDMVEESGSWSYSGDTKLVLPDDFEIRYIPWVGYFESLDYVEILERTIMA